MQGQRTINRLGEWKREGLPRTLHKIGQVPSKGALTKNEPTSRRFKKKQNTRDEMSNRVLRCGLIIKYRPIVLGVMTHLMPNNNPILTGIKVDSQNAINPN